MSKPVYDYENGDFIYRTSDNTGYDTSGNLHVRMSDHMSMDLNTGKLHYTTGWDDDDDDF